MRMRLHFFERYLAAAARMSPRFAGPSSVAGKRAGISAALLSAALLVSAGCADAKGPLDPHETYGQAQDTDVLEPIPFTEQNYDFTGETSIADLRALIGSELVWYGVSPIDPYPTGDERKADVVCDPLGYPNVTNEIEELPTFIEGIVTLHPRYFEKMSVCGQDQRYYGSYFIQDETGGIMVLKDSRISDFSFGDRVKLRVRGLVKSFQTYAVLIHDSEEIVEPGTTYDIYYEVADEELGYDDLGQVRRISGTIISEPTSTNFNELHLRSDEYYTVNPSTGEREYVEFAASIDRELAHRKYDLSEGTRVQLTGPVINSYSQYVVLISSLGQVEWLDE
jgi:hypothetical protein